MTADRMRRIYRVFSAVIDRRYRCGFWRLSKRAKLPASFKKREVPPVAASVSPSAGRFDKPFRQAQGPEPAEGLKVPSLSRVSGP
jgi:hypothetical protein